MEEAGREEAGWDWMRRNRMGGHDMGEVGTGEGRTGVSGQGGRWGGG